MLKRRNMLALADLAIGGGARAGRVVHASVQWANCSGKIVCPVTGEVVCKDRWPLGESPALGGVPACRAERGGR